MTVVYVLTLHDGSYSDYSCSLLGVRGTLEAAQQLAQRDQEAARSRAEQYYYGRTVYAETLAWEDARRHDDTLQAGGRAWTATSIYKQDGDEQREGARWYLINETPVL